MRKSTFTPLYEAFRQRLIALRKGAGLNQRMLAKRLGREHSFISRIELSERRLDVVEFYWVCRACDADPVRTASDTYAEFAALDRPAGAARAASPRQARYRRPRR